MIGDKLRVLIADDEALSRERLRQLIQKESSIEIVAECATGEATVTQIKETVPDLVFLDVSMPDMDGFAVVQQLKASQSPVIIFVTAHDRFALRAFDVHAVDFLLKPFDRERFQTALDRARQRLRANANHPAGPPAVQESRPRSLQRLSIRSQGRISFVNTTDIDWMRAADNYVELHVGKTTHLLRATMAGLLEQLPPHRFVRISRSHLVNLDRIKEIRPKTHGDYSVLLHNGTTLAGSRMYRQHLAHLLGDSN